MRKIKERTCGSHIYMMLITKSGDTEEIDVYLRPDGTKRYVTSADSAMELDPDRRRKRRDEIISAFNALY